jgi:1,4-dihydroxy-2-naphthoate octaprenyltransferase
MNPWINAMRLRTLPLSIAGIITGGVMAYKYSGIHFNTFIFILAILTALLLQILSNFAND